MTIDYLIIGQGWREACWHGNSYNGIAKLSSLIMARKCLTGRGWLNQPRHGMRFVKSADVDTLLPTTKQCYSQLADVFQQTFYIENRCCGFSQ